MHNNIFLTDEQINTQLAKVLDPFLSTDNDYQKLVASRRKAADVLAALHLPAHQWKILDDYVSAIYGCSAAYATAAYRLGFKDGTRSANLSTMDAACLGIATLLLDTLENDAVPISWQPSNRPEITQAIAQFLTNLAKKNIF